MVTINLNIRYDLDPKDRYSLMEAKFGRYDLEKDLVENCIIPAVKNYLPDIQEKFKTKAVKRRNKKSVAK
jgi:hypothetical protein